MAVPREFAAVLLTFRLDHTFSTEFPEIASSSLEIAETLDAEMCGVYHELSQVRQSETSTCRFLSAFQQLVRITASVFSPYSYYNSSVTTFL